MRGKRGDAGNAAWLLVIIAIIFIIYIILLPPGEKERLITAPETLGEGPLAGPIGGGPGGYGGSVTGYRNLMTMSPGLVSPVLQKVFSKPLGGVHLYLVEDQVQEALASSASVESNFLSGEELDFTFESNEPGLVKASLLFFVSDSQGQLRIALNDQEIFQGQVFAEDLPIVLPQSLLRSRNSLQLEVDKPSIFQFYKTHFFSLRDVMVLKTIVRANNQEVRAFTLQKNELLNLDGLTLYFTPNCGTVTRNDRLAVSLNGKLIDEREIVCDAREISIDLPRELLGEGRNVIGLAISGGDYTLEQVVVEGSVTQEKYPSTFFTVGREGVAALYNGAHVILDAKMVQDGGRKVGTFVINGFPVYMDTYDAVFVADITDLVTDGPNTFALLPTTAFDLAIVNIFLE